MADFQSRRAGLLMSFRGPCNSHASQNFERRLAQQSNMSRLYRTKVMYLGIRLAPLSPSEYAGAASLIDDAEDEAHLSLV